MYSKRPITLIIRNLFVNEKFRSFCGLPSDVPSFGSGIVMNAISTDELYKLNGMANTVMLKECDNCKRQ